MPVILNILKKSGMFSAGMNSPCCRQGTSVSPGAVPGNCMEISEQEADFAEGYLGEIRHIGFADLTVETSAGKIVDFAELPKCTCLYSDGSTHEKRVGWNWEEYRKVDFVKPGIYRISGRVCRKSYPFPFLEAEISDPCICNYHGRFFLSASGQRSVSFRISDTLQGLAKAVPVPVYTIPETDRVHANMWAQEMHIIHGVPYVFTTVGERVAPLINGLNTMAKRSFRLSFFTGICRTR